MNTSSAVNPKANQSMERNNGLIGPAGGATSAAGVGASLIVFKGSDAAGFFGLLMFIQYMLLLKGNDSHPTSPDDEEKQINQCRPFVAHTSHPALCVVNDRFLLVQSNVATGQPLWLLWPEDGKYAARFGFFKANSEILPACETIKVVKPGPFWEERVSAMTKTAIAGASHRQRGGITISPEGEGPAKTSSV